MGYGVILKKNLFGNRIEFKFKHVRSNDGWTNRAQQNTTPRTHI